MPKIKREEAAPKTASAVAQMGEFCRKQGMGSDDFMSNTGWLKAGSWRTKIDWKEVSGWKGFGAVGKGGAQPKAASGKEAPAKKPPAKK